MMILKNKPCVYTGISQPYKAGKHRGIDLVNHKTYAKTPIRATAAGVVVAASTGAWDKSYGRMVAIYHGNGNYTNHAHLSKISVKVGQKVTPGQQLGLMGTSGNSTGIHLHYEIHLGKKWNRVNPKPYMDAAGIGKEYVVNTKSSPLAVRKEAKAGAKKVGSIPKGKHVLGTKSSGKWRYIPEYGGWSSMTYLKEV